MYRYPMPLAALSPDAVNWLIAVWLFAIGGAIGSFLNVVIYRLPLGISLVRPGSHCPACKRPIRWFDNVPIFSWLVLRGRCRDCRSGISARYPIVEAVTAALFLLLGAVEVLWGGENLPLRPGELSDGVSWSLKQLCGIYAYHLLLLCTLLAAVLIESDGHQLPVRLFAPALIGGLSAPLFWPNLHPVAACPALDGWLAGATGAAAGLAAGLLSGWLVSQLCVPKRKTGAILGAACVGVFLGWQAVVALTVVSGAIHLPLTALRRFLPALRRIPLSAWLALATLAWILAWARLLGCWPGLRCAGGLPI